ncbi:MAG: hypothetical protein E7680_01365 [Ruminococcaceae bacterium]|nr:hypothetical protein [Oscillospiraceae bacterium]
MKKNLRNCIEHPTYGERVDLFNPGDPGVAQTAGLLPDINHAKTALWRFSERTCVRFPLSAQAFSAFRFFTFSVWAVSGAGGTFVLRLESDETLGGESGYTCLLPITHNGWNDYRIELPFSGVSGEPLGWDFIRAVVLDCQTGGQSNRKETVLSIGQMSLWKGNAPGLYTKRPELKGAAVFSKTGSFAIVNRTRVPVSPDENLFAKPFEENGVLWLPMAPIAAVLGRKASADDRAQTLRFVYHRKAYSFGAQPFYMENGMRTELRFRPQFVNGTLFFPSDFLCSFFHWRQTFRDVTGLIILSNRKEIFDRELEGPFIRTLNAELTLSKPSGRQMLEDLRRRWDGSSRDRLFLTQDGWMELRRACKTDSYAAVLFGNLKAAYGKRSETYLAKPIFAVSEAPVFDKTTVCMATDRILSFGALWRLTGDKAFAIRAAAEVEALSGIDWKTKEDPAVAALAALAVSLYYDWSRASADEAFKMRMERVLLRGFLRPILDSYGEKTILWRSSPETAARVYEGLTAAAFVLSEAFPETTIRALEKITVGVPHYCVSCYAPDGGFAEGANAWQNCTAALTGIFAMFTSCCGNTYGMDALPGFAQTALFGTVIETSSGAWDPKNSSKTCLNASFLPWFSVFGDDLPARLRREEILSGKKRSDVWDLIYWSAQAKNTGLAKSELPPDAVYRRAGLAVLRSGWDESAMILSLHGGCNAFDGISDAGSFALDSEGETFFTGACALFSGGGDQSRIASAALLQARGAADRAFAVVDTEEIAKTIKRGKRGVCLLAGRTIAVVQDELTVSEPIDFVWTAYTSATILKLRRRSVILEKNGKKLICRIAGATAQWKAESAVGDLTKLTIALSAQGKVRLAVACKAFSEGDDPNEIFYTPEPISKWGE